MIEFSEMNEFEIDKICYIENCCFVIPWTRNMFLEELENTLAHYTVIKYMGNTVGYAGMWFICDEAHITNIAIDPQYQNKGLSKRLLAKIIEDARDHNIKKMTLEVRKSNYIAIHLYKQFQFEELGIRKNYYEDTNEDALILWRDI